MLQCYKAMYTEHSYSDLCSAHKVQSTTVEQVAAAQSGQSVNTCLAFETYLVSVGAIRWYVLQTQQCFLLHTAHLFATNCKQGCVHSSTHKRSTHTRTEHTF